MSNPLDCNPCCETPLNVSIPGVAGQGSFSFTTADFLVPALGGSVTAAFINTDWMSVDQTIFIEGAGLFTVTAIVDSTHATIQYQNIAANTAAGNTISFPAQASPAGIPGADGTDGGASYTVTTAAFTVPAISANTASVAVASSAWMVIGQVIFVEGAGYFRVVSKADATHFVGTYMDVSYNTFATNIIASGAAIAPAGPDLANPLTVSRGGTGSATATLARVALGLGELNLSVYAAGTAAPFTNTSALLNFGTTDPSLIITGPGVYLLLARVRVDYTGATFAAVRTGTLKLRRTNNTAADIANSSASFLTDIITTLTYTLSVVQLPPVIYTTTNSNDVLEIWGDISVVPTAGTLDAAQAELIAIRLYNQTI